MKHSIECWASGKRHLSPEFSFEFMTYLWMWWHAWKSPQCRNPKVWGK